MNNALDEIKSTTSQGIFKIKTWSSLEDCKRGLLESLAEIRKQIVSNKSWNLNDEF